MKCPLCNTEMKIMSSSFVQNDGNIFDKMVMTCRNKTCSNYGKEVKTIYSPLGEIEEDTEAVVQDE